MRTLIAVAALSLALTGFAIAPASAQVAEREAVLLACGGATADATSCDIAVAAFVAVVRGLPAAEKDALLADLVIALANTGAPGGQDIAAAAIRSVATEFTDTNRAAAAVQVALAVETGTAPEQLSVQALSSPS